MDLQIKKLKVNISTTSKQNSLTDLTGLSPTRHSQITLSPHLRRRLRKPVSKCISLIQFFKHIKRRMHFLLEGSVGDFESRT